MLVGLLAVVASALFSGAALYVLLVEHPARGALPVGAQLRQWKPAYARGAVMQAGLAAGAAVLGIVAWGAGSDRVWLAGAAAMVGAIAFTLLVIWPTNAALKAIPADAPTPEAPDLLAQWGRLHGVRTGIGLVGVVLYGWALLR